MLVAATVVLVGLLAGIVAVEGFALRLSGVLAVPVLGVYALYDPVAVPIFAASTAVTYHVVGRIRDRTLWYGRSVLVASIVVGAVGPFLAFLALDSLLGNLRVHGGALFVSSVLPGVAAYNYHQLDDDRERLVDVGASLAVLAGLVALGWWLVGAAGGWLATVTPPVLLERAAWVARAQGVGVEASPRAVVVPYVAATAVLLGGLLVTEGVYRRWGVRLVGLVAAPLLALFALRNVAILPAYALVLGSAYWATERFHDRTLVYGRVLLAVGVCAGLLVSVPVAVVAGLLGLDGFTVLFVGILGGVGAYNLHRVAPAERTDAVTLAAGAVVVALAALQPFVRPTAGGLLATRSLWQVLLAAPVLAVAAKAAFDLEALHRTTTTTERGVSA